MWDPLQQSFVDLVFNGVGILVGVAEEAEQRGGDSSDVLHPCILGC